MKNFNQTAIPWRLWKHVEVIACSMYSVSDAFLRVRKINIKIYKIKVLKIHLFQIPDPPNQQNKVKSAKCSHL